MPDNETNTTPAAAVLELGNGLRLAGRVELVGEQTLRLGQVRLLGGKGNTRLSLQPGSRAQLQVEATGDSQGTIAALAVSIAGLEGNDLRLDMEDPQSAAAASCIAALTDAAPGASAKGDRGSRHGLLEAAEAVSLEGMASRLDAFLQQVPESLYASASRPQGGLHASALLEAANLVDTRAEQIKAAFRRQLRDRFRDPIPSGEERHLWQNSEGSSGKLDLVDLDEFERFLAVDRIVRAGREMHGEAMECLTLRFAEVLACDPLALRLPVHVAELCAALGEALGTEGVARAATPRLLEEFNRRVVTGLDGLYESLNGIFIDAGVRPTLERELRSKGSMLQRAAASRRGPPRQTGGGAAEVSNDHDNAADLAEMASRMGVEERYRAVSQALDQARELRGAPGAGEGPGGAPPAGGDAIVEALAALQGDPDQRAVALAEGSLARYLSEHSNELDSLAGTAGPGADSLNRLELVDRLFSAWQQSLDIDQHLTPRLAELQVPLAKLAMLEPEFFMDQAHSARAVVDKLSQLAASGNFPNPALEDKVGDIVADIVDNYDRDSGVFDQALGRIESLVAQQASAQARNVERVVQTQQGQERLHHARLEVDRILREHLPEQSVPLVLVNLLNAGWRDELVLAHVREGPESGTFQEQLHTLDLLLLCLAGDDDHPDEDGAGRRALDAKPLIDTLQTTLSESQPGNLDLEQAFNELRQVVAGDEPAETAPLSASELVRELSPGQFRKRLGKTHRLRRWVARVEALAAGTWLSYTDREGQRRRMQLAWVSSDRQRFVFVNERGQKVAQLNSVQLARKLSHGAQPPLPADNLSLVEQSLYSSLEDLQKTLTFTRNHDELTRLINRGTFIEQVGRALRHAQQRGSRHAILHLNIDDFKLVNSVYDTITGDQVLVEFARLLAQLHSTTVSSARLGDDDFGVLLIGYSLEQAQELAEKIRGDIEQASIELDDDMVSFTVSIGIAPIAEHSPDVDTIIASARGAMLQAKESGRNQVAVAKDSPELVTVYRKQQLRSRQDLEKALSTDSFVLRAQPIIKSRADAEENTSRHYEILLGVLDEEGAVCSPSEFIASAERHGFMTVVDRWVVREAFRWISSMIDAQKVVPTLAINLSGASITDDDFMDYLFEQISEFGVGTNRLCFEITEVGTIGNLVKAADFVRAFRNIGCKFSLDDFGTGLASHNYLRELPVDYVKIDGSFITGLDHSRDDFTMARSINDLAHFLGQETIAESVENESIVGKLREIGVDYLQGWGVGHPKPLTAITDELSNLEK